jgi:hypothetical protein
MAYLWGWPMVNIRNRKTTFFLTGYVGYFVVDKMYPSFYYTPVEAGKKLWLIAQALSIALY